jgi:hypothetical protein
MMTFQYMSSQINDIREMPDFRGFSFSQYKKTDVRNQFIDNMKKGKVEPACYWCAELICAGHYEEVWESIFYFVGKHIHIGNPKIPIYLEKRYTVFRNIMNQGHFSSPLQLRNNPTIRKMFAEIVVVITLSVKKTSFETIKINREDEFDITQMTDRMKATDATFAAPIFKPEDPKELMIPTNEFAFHIGGNTPNMLLACYWVEWMIEYDVICRKRKEPCLCERRTIPGIENKFQRDIIWIVWDVLSHYSRTKGTYIEMILTSLRNLFAVRYTTGTAKKRKYLLYYAVELLTETVPVVDFISAEHKLVLANVAGNIDLVYKQIKKNEKSPNTDYLFHNLEAEHNLEQSVRKMEMMNAMEFLPRT